MTRALAALATIGVLASSAGARADVPSGIAQANAAAAAGDWARVEQLVAPLRGAPIALADRAEVLRLSGLAAYFLGQLAPAEQFFLAFLGIDPDGSLDPALYPPEALAFFEGIKTRHRAEITAHRPPPKRYAWLNLIIVEGQRQNGEPVKGAIIGGVFGTLLVGQIATYFVLRSWCEQNASGTATCDGNGTGTNHVHAADDLRVANYLLGIGWIATYAYGVYDGVRGYRARSRELSLQPYASTSDHANVVGIAGSF